MGATLAQKILARASSREQVEPGEYVTAKIDWAMVNFKMGEIATILARNGIEKVWDGSRVICVLDHWNPPDTINQSEMFKQGREAIKKYQIENFYGQRTGIGHQIMFEKCHVFPGELVVGSDSHTVTYGAFGTAATGIGQTEMAYVLSTGTLWFKVPETIKINLHGNLLPLVMSKDVMLHIAKTYSVDFAQYKAVEFSGPLSRQMSLSSRMTMSNMSVDVGAKFGFFEPDDAVYQYLKQRTDHPFTMMKPDEDATYEKIYEVDVTNLEPQVALPSSLDNTMPISQVGDIKIDQAFLGSCTNGRLEDLRVAAEIMRGKKVHPDARMLVFPASTEVYRNAIEEGILLTLAESGAIICNSNCGPCGGGHMGILAAGETCISSTNRNFKGRMGSPDSEVYLASPATVAASAISGKITDPRDFKGDNDDSKH